MNRVMRIMRDENKELHVERFLSSIQEVIQDQRIHVMDDRSVMNLKTIDSEIATSIASNHIVSNLSPFS